MQQPRKKCRRCNNWIPVNKTGVFRKHSKLVRNGLNNLVPHPCEGSGAAPGIVKTYFEDRFPKGFMQLIEDV